MISVIVPVYNTEKYLNHCIDSILNQTYSDLELILVDDGSADGCPAICDMYAGQDPRVRVIHKENGGVCSARNAGLDAARGDYIAFVDSDDYIDPAMYEKMMAQALEYDCDVVMCDCVKEYPGEAKLYTHDIPGGYYDLMRLKSEYYPHLLIMENVEYPATISNCTILWKSTLNVSGMRYEHGIRYSEDLLFGARILRAANSFYYMKGAAFYHYVMNPLSATHKYVPDKWEDYQRLHQSIRRVFANDPEYDFNPQIDLCLLFFLYNTVGEIYGAPLSDSGKRQKILGILRTPEAEEMLKRIQIRKLPVSDKLKILTFLYRRKLGISILVRYYR